MSKFLQILLVACFAVALCTAEAPRRGVTRFQAAPRRSRVLARQEEAPAAVTPYPSAAELKPEVAFDEVEESAQAPAESADAALPEHQPDQTYGPPEIETDEEPLPEEEPAVQADLPVEEPAEVEESTLEEDEQAAAAAAEEEEQAQSERLVFGRRIGARRSARPAKLRVAPKPKSARQQQQPQFVAQPMFYYQPW